jgi:cell wall-associated NlpC family hydrolase
MADRSLAFDLLWRDRQFNRGVDQSGRKLRGFERDANRFGDGVSRSFNRAEKGGERFRQRISGIGAVAGGAALAGLGILGAGALKLASEFDDAYDTIRVSTGRTGKSLDGLKDDFRAVVRDVPADFGDASTAIAELSRRTGQTGKPLQDLAKRTLELTRLAGGDLTDNIASVTRLFGDWGIKTGDQSKTLDKLFRASQATGIGVDRLADSVVKFGAPLRQLGFSFDSSIALLAKFEKEGVNSQLVMSGMRIALGNLAKAGKDPQKGFLDLAQRIKDAGSSAAANRIAIEAFGQRAGPDMAAAIREGRLSIKDLQAQISGGKDTILGAARDAEDFGEKWKRVSNRLKLLAEPVVTKGLDILSTKMGQLEGFLSNNLLPKLGGLRTAWDRNRDAILGLLDPFGEVNGKMKTSDERAQELADSLTAVTEGLGKFARGAKTASDFLNGLHGTSVKVALGIRGAIISINKPIFGFISAVMTANHKVLAAGATMAEALHLPQARALRRAEQNMGRFVAEAKADMAAVDAKARDTGTKVPGGSRSGFGGSLRRAEQQTRGFRGTFNRQIGNLAGKTVAIKVQGTFQPPPGFSMREIVHFRARGGPIAGPGTTTSDSIPAMLSTGEHVLSAREVRGLGGHDAVEQMRKQARGFATGGAVEVKASLPSARAMSGAASTMVERISRLIATNVRLGAKVTMAGNAAIQAFIRATDRLPYRWGAAGPGAYDCSGLVGAVYGKMRGQPGAGRGARFFTTATVGGAPGLKPGLGGLLNIGVTPGRGHMAGSYGGLNFEARSTATGIFTGTAARSPSSFARRYHMAKGGRVDQQVGMLADIAGIDIGGDAARLRVLLSRHGRTFDQGGYLMPGTTVAHNRTGKPERVLPPGPVVGRREAKMIAEELAAALRANPAPVYLDRQKVSRAVADGAIWEARR